MFIIFTEVDDSCTSEESRAVNNRPQMEQLRDLFIIQSEFVCCVKGIFYALYTFYLQNKYSQLHDSHTPLLNEFPKSRYTGRVRQKYGIYMWNGMKCDLIL